MAGPDPPDFIKFLFSEKPTFDCYFIVGKKTLVEPERVGAVKMMLMAHSVVFRSELEDSALKEKGDIAVKDIYPDTFRTLLKYIYGYDITGDLEFDEADNLLYAAEKYIMSNLKNKLALRLMALLTPDNVCSLLNNPACANHLQLYAHVTKILRYETDKVLASPQFLEVCSTEGFLTILQQDGLAVPEIELWRAALKWAKHRAGRGDGKYLREEIERLTKHLRICTISHGDFSREVVPTKVLHREEEVAVSESIDTQVKHSGLTTFCSEIQPRNLLQRKPELSHGNYNLFLVYHKKLLASNELTFLPVSKSSIIELKPLNCVVKAENGIVSKLALGMFQSTCQVDCKITVTRINTTYYETPVVITFSERVRVGRSFTIPLTSEGDTVKLLPNSKYSVKVVFADNQIMCDSCILSLYFTKRATLY